MAFSRWKRAQPIAQIENDRDPGKIDAQIFPQPSDHVQPRHSVFVEKQSCAFASARLDQSAVDEALERRQGESRRARRALRASAVDSLAGKKLFHIALQSSVGHQLPRIEARRISKLLEQFSFRGAQPRRIDDSKPCVLIAAPAASAI